jgi:NarL family two-component system response regulator YdfI
MVLQITPLERSVLQLLASGAEIHALTHRLGLNEQAVEGWLASLFSRMGVASRTEALAAAARRGLVTSVEQR